MSEDINSTFGEDTFNKAAPPTPPKRRRERHGPDICGGPARCGACAVKFYVEEYEPKVLPAVALATAEIKRLEAALKESGHEHQYVQLGTPYEKYLNGKVDRMRLWQKVYCTRCAVSVEIETVDRRLQEDR